MILGLLSVDLFPTASAQKSESIFGKRDAQIQWLRASFVRPRGRRALWLKSIYERFAQAK
ncbi:hypothetical protein CES85_1482 [Ochrobactrum quorumnocens]|uniref:Uncharacterized protein n=1 Tax=Ochrobactrum quorumnocens TaxID=271865 RepID=A0A248UKX3_9HYPH|nr:hypothetical protein CES85_1482 [[Ochrobactrum] quorumnocens]